MKKLVIADITTLTYKNAIYGHFLKLAQQYLTIFQNDFDVNVCGGITYKKYIDASKYQKLPFFVTRKETQAGMLKRIIMKIKEFINALVVVHSDVDIVIFQCYSEIPIFLALLITNIKNKKVFMIQYQKGLQTEYSQKLYNKVSKKISGVITSSSIVGDYYGINYIIVPDYFPIGKIEKQQGEYLYDFVVLGTISDWKDYEDVVSSFKDTKYKVKIAGKFFDKKRFEQLKARSTPNIEFEDKYLTDEEYNNYILKSKFIILPYKKNYDEKSSGVVLDAIYHKTPVIVSDLKSFSFVKKENIGLLYSNSIANIIVNIEHLIYKELLESIEIFIKKKNIQKQELIEFIQNCM